VHEGRRLSLYQNSEGKLSLFTNTQDSRYDHGAVRLDTKAWVFLHNACGSNFHGDS
jgi:hypothetical protein